MLLPDGRIVMQRRTMDAPSGAGKLSFFGGTMEEGESPLEAARRELGEETDLPVDSLEFVPAVSTIVQKDVGSKELWRANLFWVKIESADFKFFEGDGAEVYTVEELLARPDLTTFAIAVFDKLFGGKNGTKHYRT